MKAIYFVTFFIALNATRNFTFHEHSDPAAKCLDGSQAGFYFQKGRQSDKFLVYFEGGALCARLSEGDTLKDCYDRSLTALGSSSKYLKSRSFDTWGYLSPSKRNPFHDWNRVFFPYCDGSLHQGSRLQPMKHNNKDLYFRGTNITLAHFSVLDQKYGLFEADEIIISGSSAGGIASFIWGNYVYDNAENKDGVVVVADSAVFINDFKTPHGFAFRDLLKPLLKIVNTQIDMPLKQCASYYKENQVQCFQPGVSARFIKPRLFLIQAQYDTWGIFNILMLKCAPHTNPTSLQNCDAVQRASIQQYRAKINQAVNNVTLFKKNGAWSVSCSQHVFLEDLTSLDSINYRIPTTIGRDMKKAVLSFLDGGKRNYIDKANWPDNKGCSALTQTTTKPPVASHFSTRHDLNIHE